MCESRKVRKGLSSTCGSIALFLTVNSPQIRPRSDSKYFSKKKSFGNTLRSIESALSLFHLLETLCFRLPGDNLQPGLAPKLSAFAGEQLRRTWGVPLKADPLALLLEAELFYSDDLLSQVDAATVSFQGFVKTGEPSADYPLLKKDTMGVHYRVLFDGLVKALSMKTPQKKPVFKGSSSTSAMIPRPKVTPVNTIEITPERILTCCQLFDVLVGITKSEEPQATSIYVAALKHGRAFVDIFQKICLPFYEKIIRLETNAVMEQLKFFQKGTRSLQVRFPLIF